VGGYHDLPRAMRFFTTGWYEHDGESQRITPDDTGRMVLAYSSLDYLENEADRDVFDRMVAERTRTPDIDLSPLAGKLSEGARAVYDLAVNDDPARFAELFAQLPSRMRADIDQLDLARHDLRPLKARLILVHGRNDNVIPWPESQALAAAVPEGQARVFLIQRVLGHVDLSAPNLLTWRFWQEDLPDLWRLWRVVDLLLAEREADA
jgi:pimeloyl-ACP methyl ester carboxylesterase